MSHLQPIMRDPNAHYGNKPRKKIQFIQDDGDSRHLSMLSHKQPLDSELTRPFPSLFGASIGHRPPGHIRILSQNIRGLPKSTLDPLNHAWSSRLSAYKADIALLSEINVNWSTVPHEDSLAVRSKQYWTTTRCQTAWNKHNQSDSTHLQGGTANILIGNVSHRSTLSGSDPTGLGRWSWTLIRGPANRMLLTASAYAPPKTKFSSNTVAGQHVTHLRAQNDDRSAQAAFFEDLGKEIKKWQESKYSIVLGIDANADVESPTFGQWHRSLGLTNPLLQAYGPAPSTYQRGSRPIDAILTSIDVEVTRGGMIAPGDCFNSDHAGIWIDIQSDTLLGKLDLGPRKTPNASTPRTRRLWKTISRTTKLIFIVMI